MRFIHINLLLDIFGFTDPSNTEIYTYLHKLSLPEALPISYGRAVQQAKAVVRDAPDLAAKVRAGEIALDAADRQRKQRIAAMPKPAPAPKQRQIMLTLRTHTGGEVKYPQPQAKATVNQPKGADRKDALEGKGV